MTQSTHKAGTYINSNRTYSEINYFTLGEQVNEVACLTKTTESPINSVNFDDSHED